MSTADVYNVFGRTVYWRIGDQVVFPVNGRWLTTTIPTTERALNSDVNVISLNYYKTALHGQNKPLDTEYDNILYNAVRAVMVRWSTIRSKSSLLVEGRIGTDRDPRTSDWRLRSKTQSSIVIITSGKRLLIEYGITIARVFPSVIVFALRKLETRETFI